MMAFPALLLAIVLAALLRPSLWIVALVIALVNWVQVARIIYTETRGLVERDFHSCRAVAARSRPSAASLFRHIAAASFAERDRLGNARRRNDSAP